MLKHTIVYTNYDGESCKEDVYFNLTQAEAIHLDFEFEGGLAAAAKRIDREKDPKAILDFFEKIIMASYGEKSEDRKYFLKSEERARMFLQSAMYDALFVELMADGNVAAEFFNSLIQQALPQPTPANSSSGGGGG